MDFISVNLWAVLVAGLVYFVLGALWYSPVLFANPWMTLNKFKEEDFKEGSPAPFIVAFITAMIVPLVLANLIKLLGDYSLIGGIKAGLLIWAGFVGPFALTNYMFSMRPTKLFLIDSGFNLTGLIIMGTILGLWP